MRNPGAHLLDRGVPDVMATDDLPLPLAAEIDHLAGRSERWVVPGGEASPAIAARALISRGAYDEARAVASTWRADVVATWGFHDAVAALRAVSRVGPASVVSPLIEVVAAAGGGFLVENDLPLGPSGTHVGVGFAALGDEERAVAALHEGVDQGDARAPVWGALARLELARVLLGLPEGDEDRAIECLASARLFFRAGGFAHLSSVAERLTGPPAVVSGAEPGLGHLVPDERWTVGFGVQLPEAVPAVKGLRAIHILVRRPGQAVPTVVLDRLIDGAAPDDSVVAAWIDGRDAFESAEALRARFVDDRIRSRVSKLIHRTIDWIGQSHRFLGRHLAGAVRTGHSCRYEPVHPVRWRC